MSKIPKILRGLTRNTIRTLFSIVGLFIVNIQVIPFLIGCLFVLMGDLLRLWSKGHLQQAKVLTMSGPYRWSRNPFYLANGIIDIGICLIINRIEFSILYLIIWIFVHYRKIFREERELEGIFGETFLQYEKFVPRLIPLPWSRLPAHIPCNASFSWRNPNITKRIEIPRFIRVLCYPLLFLCAYGIRKEGLDFIYDYNVTGLFAISCLLYMYIMSELLIRPLKHRKPILPDWASSNICRGSFLIIFLIFLFIDTYLETETYNIFSLAVISTICCCIFFAIFPNITAHSRIIINEGLISIVASWLFELPWATFIGLLYYSCILADIIILHKSGSVQVELPPNRLARHLKLALQSIVLLLIIDFFTLYKEIFHD